MIFRGCLFFLIASLAWPQVCRLSVAGLNRNRRVAGPVSVECPGGIHTAPFGNWGATSNFGSKRDGHQFDGWCHDSRVCDTNGNCSTDCRDGWYEWNSCTTHALYKAPNCTLFNAAECTEQASTTDVNVLGTQTVDLPATCPVSNGSSFDQGGCSAVTSYARSNNYMSLYELDPFTGDELIQSVYYPGTLAALKCNAWGCPTATSDWVDPIDWDSPKEPRKVFAQMAMIVNSGTFVDTNNQCRIQALPLQVVSSASFRGGELAPDSIATLFTGDVAALTESATAQPLPGTLSGVQVRVTDAGGQVRNAGLVFASPRQVNFVLPAGLREGPATIAVVAGNVVRATGTAQIARVQPGLYTISASGEGVAAAVGVRVAADGTQTVADTMPFDLGGSAEQFVLVLFGTGIRGAGAGSAVQATVGGTPVEVQYAGAQRTFAGLDQVNLLLPKILAGRGLVDIRLTVDGKVSNTVYVLIR